MFGKEVLLSKPQVEKINSLVPKQFRKDSWNKKDFNFKNGRPDTIFRSKSKNSQISKKIKKKFWLEIIFRKR